VFQIVWDNRKQGDLGNDCLVSVDGTDCPVPQQRSLAPKPFFSHKFRGHGLRYEITICIIAGDIVSIVGPFPCGNWLDIEIFCYFLKGMLDRFERVEADDGYVGEDPESIKVPGGVVERQLYIRGHVRRRHETVNKRIKQFKCRVTVFRHDLSFHGPCFWACAMLTQLAINHVNPFSIDDCTDP
jgi:hypothetical protein